MGCGDGPNFSIFSCVSLSKNALTRICASGTILGRGEAQSLCLSQAHSAFRSSPVDSPAQFPVPEGWCTEEWCKIILWHKGALWLSPAVFSNCQRSFPDTKAVVSSSVHLSLGPFWMRNGDKSLCGMGVVGCWGSWSGLMVQTGGSPFVLTGKVKFFKWKKLKDKNTLSGKFERVKWGWSLEPSHRNATMQRSGRKGVQRRGEGNKKGKKQREKKRNLAGSVMWNLKTLRKNHSWQQDFLR